MIYKTIHEEEANTELFDFLLRTCIDLDTIESPGKLFHLIFALRFTKHLGFMPQMNYSASKKFFNMKEGMFQGGIPEHPYFLDETQSLIFFQMLDNLEETTENIQIPAKHRDLLLEKILTYYQLHVPGFTGLKSHQVLHTVLS